MNNKIANSFKNIKAEEDLKQKTKLFLKKEIAKRENNNFYYIKKISFSFTSFALIFIIMFFSYNYYFIAETIIDVDVNPSIELSVNKLNKVIKVYAYNVEGKKIVSNIDIKYKNYQDAIKIILDEIEENGYILNDEIVSVTVQTNNKTKENIILTSINYNVKQVLNEHHSKAQTNVFSVSSDDLFHAHNYNISPAKYLALLELIKIDETTTIEENKSHSITEIKKLVHEHSIKKINDNNYENFSKEPANNTHHDEHNNHK